MNMEDSAHRENMLSAASAAASSARRSEKLLQQLVAKDRAAVMSEWTDRDMSVGNVIYKAGSVTIVDILDHAAREALKDQGETPVQDDDAEWLRNLAHNDQPYFYAADRERLERIASRLSPTPETGLVEARDALQAMMDAWFDYHDAHSLTQPVTGAAGYAFEKALAARDMIDAALSNVSLSDG